MSRILLRQLPLYHLSAGAALLGRTFLFPLLQALGLHYLPNIFLGILAGAAIKYVLIDRYVFKGPVKGPMVEKGDEAIRPPQRTTKKVR